MLSSLPISSYNLVTLKASRSILPTWYNHHRCTRTRIIHVPGTVLLWTKQRARLPSIRFLLSNHLPLKKIPFHVAAHNTLATYSSRSPLKRRTPLATYSIWTYMYYVPISQNVILLNLSLRNPVFHQSEHWKLNQLASPHHTLQFTCSTVLLQYSTQFQICIPRDIQSYDPPRTHSIPPLITIPTAHLGYSHNDSLPPPIKIRHLLLGILTPSLPNFVFQYQTRPLFLLATMSTTTK